MADMNLEHLSDADKVVVGEAFRAAANGPFFDEDEFHTLFGLTRSEVRVVADSWPVVELQSSKVHLAVNNSLNNLLGYPHRQDSIWSEWISVNRQQLDELFSRLRGGAGGGPFERMS